MASTTARHEVGLGVALLGLLGGGCHGGHLQAGPVIGYSPTRGATLGWEAGAGELGLLRVNAGGSYQLDPASAPGRATPDAGEAPVPEGKPAQPDGGDPLPASVHYLALEPFGLSLGADYTNTGRLGFMGGVWAGWVYDPKPGGAFRDSDPSPDRLRPNTDCPDYDPEPTLLLSGALGVRYLGGEWEIYVTPKAVVFYCFEYAS